MILATADAEINTSLTGSALAEHDLRREVCQSIEAHLLNFVVLAEPFGHLTHPLPY